MEQGSPEWHQARLGKVTASRVADVIARTKTGWGASRANYLAELVAERLTGTPAPNYTNAAMEHGTACEPEARAAYEFLYDVDVQQVGFIEHPALAGFAGCSPDGLVSDDGLLEIKCPTTATHINTLLLGTIAGKYNTQMQWQMACTGRKWCDFVSYDPRLPGNMRLFVQRVLRDDLMIVELVNSVGEFLDELESTLDALCAKYEREEAA